ncbi:MAG: VOC family protein [Proteobacteria bacterium]|nr:VOC family protein [Pseudomonadota bacterium]
MIRSLQCVALTVPSIEQGAAFYKTMGLEGQAQGDSMVFRCVGRDQDQLYLVPGKEKGIAWVSWGTTAEELAEAGEKLHACDISLLAPPKHAPDGGIWFRDPDGVLVNLRAVPAAPQTRPAVEINNPGHQYYRLGRRGAPHRQIDARPRKLGHLLKFSTDVNRDVRFYTELLGMKLSDRIGDKEVAFLRCGGDSDHHTLAIALSDKSGLHHLSWEMGNLDQLQLCAERVIAAGYKDAWGVGRHIYGSNYFHYVRDPWMGLCEFYWDIDFIPENAAWLPEVASASGDDLHKSLYQWASVPPPDDFLHNFERAA